ncbi:MAG: hypothetical protein M1837_004372 [Sclerophora amabilis]|nr:MAG: hypothetical protein M1837_004372 [Sclerophora amabilis]
MSSEGGTLEQVKASAGFSDPKEIKTTVNRPDIRLTIRTMQHSACSFKDLWPFLLLPAPEIPKTIIYFERIDDIRQAVENLRRRLQSLDRSAKGVEVVCAFHSLLALSDKKRILQEFRKPDSAHRIVMATDALGMGIDNPNIGRVINWKLPKGSVSSLYQRAGRAAHAADVSGELIWLVESWCYGAKTQDDLPLSQTQSRRGTLSHLSQSFLVADIEESSGNESVSSTGSADSRRRKSRKTAADRRKDMTSILYGLINNGICLRKTILAFFNEVLTDEEPPRAGCCSVCKPDRLPWCPESFIEDNPNGPSSIQSKKLGYTPAYRQKAARKALLDWRARVAATILEGTLSDQCDAPLDFLLDDKTLKK